MTQNEKKLLTVFTWMCIGILFMFSSLSSIERIHTAQNAEQHYTSAVSHIVDSGKNLAELKEKLIVLKSNALLTDNQRSTQTAADMAAHIRTALALEGIKPSRYQISGKVPDESVEFVLRCDAIPFFRFLKIEAEKQTYFVFTSMSIKPITDSSMIDVVFRVRHAK